MSYSFGLVRQGLSNLCLEMCIIRSMWKIYDSKTFTIAFAMHISVFWHRSRMIQRAVMPFYTFNIFLSENDRFFPCVLTFVLFTNDRTKYYLAFQKSIINIRVGFNDASIIHCICLFEHTFLPKCKPFNNKLSEMKWKENLKKWIIQNMWSSVCNDFIYRSKSTCIIRHNWTFAFLYVFLSFYFWKISLELLASSVFFSF